MAVFTITEMESSGFPVICFEGYCAAEGGKSLLKKVHEVLQSKRNRIIIDFVKCTIINSPGMASLLDTTMLIVEDFKGKCVLIGMDNSKKQFLQMTGVLPLAATAETIEEACRLMGH
ncbi:MAG: hypothetical protein HQM08_16545 [Candidatus Riflebacteria bacterium]|nr:hypothetical protein [Candidatus Riflebacteria bacterium]